ncbi:MAG: hypothetical protein WDO16_23785 [Bacteroidota bacterium]
MRKTILLSGAIAGYIFLACGNFFPSTSQNADTKVAGSYKDSLLSPLLHHQPGTIVKCWDGPKGLLPKRRQGLP